MACTAGEVRNDHAMAAGLPTVPPHIHLPGEGAVVVCPLVVLVGHLERVAALVDSRMGRCAPERENRSERRRGSRNGPLGGYERHEGSCLIAHSRIDQTRYA